MRKANNLELQGGTYHVRLAVPKDVQQRFGGRRILSKSLKTGNHKEALDRRLPILASWKAQIKAAREGTPLPDGWQEDFVSLHNEIGDIANNLKLALIGLPAAPLPPVDPEFEARLKNNPRFVAAFESFVKEHLKDGMEGKVRAIDAIAQGIQTMQPELIFRRLNPPANQKAEILSIFADPSNYKARSPITDTLLRQFREHRTLHRISAKNIDTQEARLKALNAYLNKEGKELNFDNISSFIKTIERSPATQQQYVLAGSAFWKWAMKYNPNWRKNFKDTPCPFSNHEFPKLKGKAKIDASRKGYMLKEISQLHTAALKSKQPALADLIAIGYYTGARIEEICQLKKSNIVNMDGVLTLDITDSKTEAGIRKVPVHPALAATIKRLCDASTDDWLLPIKSNNKYDKRSSPLSKKFGRLRTRLGFSSNYVFHSLRMTTITQMHQAGVSYPLIAELVGHETGTITFDVYSQGASTLQKFDAISRIPKFACPLAATSE